MTIKIQFTEAEIKQLDYERYHHPPPRVQRKMEALWLKSQGASHQDIYKYAGMSANTLCQYLRDYQSGGIEQLKQLNFYHPNRDLCQFQSTLAEYFRQTPPATVNEARATILELTGINRSPTRVRHLPESSRFVLSQGWNDTCQGRGCGSGRFSKKHLEPRLTEAKAGSRAVFFVDAAHFVLAPFLGWLWCVKRLFLKAPSGRQRVNILAALKAFSHELVMVTNHDYVNAQTVCELLHKLSQLSLDVPLTLVMDNARYQKCRAVQELALPLNIE